MTEDEVRRALLNPFYAVEIAPALAMPHEPMIPEEQWVLANVRLIEEMGAEAWLRELLAVLKGDFVTAPTESRRGPPGGRAPHGRPRGR